MENWDFFVAHDGQDADAAKTLKKELESRHASVFLDVTDLKAGDAWMTLLPAAVKTSRVVIVLVSVNWKLSPYLQDEISRAIDHYTDAPDSRSIVPVILPGATIENLPYGLRAFQVVRNAALEEVAVLLLDKLASLKARPNASLLASSAQLVDRIYAGAEMHLHEVGGGGPPRIYRSRFSAEGTDLVERGYGYERQRITGSELDTKLSATDRAHLEVLERSMEVHYAIWEARYPERSTDPDAKSIVRSAILEMENDLKEVLRYIETCGFNLDDHYIKFRSAINTLREGKSSEV
jgi:hypothetical protein